MGDLAVSTTHSSFDYHLFRPYGNALMVDWEFFTRPVHYIDEYEEILTVGGNGCEFTV